MIENGMVAQFKAHPEAQTKKPQKKEMSLTQPMPSHLLQAAVKKANKQHQQYDHLDNLNYQSLENGQQML